MGKKMAGLSKTQLGRMHGDLLDRQRWLLNDARGKMDGPEVDGTHGDEADLAYSAQHTELAIDTRVRESREIQLVGHALQKIDGGTYGQCAECRESIPFVRLEALPFAEYCIDCQEKLEREGAFVPEEDEIRFVD